MYLRDRDVDVVLAVARIHYRGHHTSLAGDLHIEAFLRAVHIEPITVARPQPKVDAPANLLADDLARLDDLAVGSARLGVDEEGDGKHVIRVRVAARQCSSERWLPTTLVDEEADLPNKARRRESWGTRVEVRAELSWRGDGAPGMRHCSLAGHSN